MYDEKTIKYLVDWSRDNESVLYQEMESVGKNHDLVKMKIVPAFIRKLRESLRIFLEDIKQAYSGGSRMGVFILCCCFIDCLSAYYSGSESNYHDFEEYLKKYLDKYVGKKFYELLRSKLIHNYSERGFCFAEGKSDVHLVPSGNKTIINLENLLSEIENAFEIYFSDLEDSDQLLINSVKAHDRNPLIREQEVKGTQVNAAYVVSGAISQSTSLNNGQIVITD